MEAASLVVRSFRNLSDAEFEIPAEGVVLVGPNGQGKTNFLEALAYPVLFRSLRGALDREIGRFDGPGFHVGVRRSDGAMITATYATATKRKRITVDDDEPSITAALGQWLAVAFLPTDLALIQGGASERRRWLDRMLSLAGPTYLVALMRYRGVLAQRNAALRLRDERSVDAFDPQLARTGAAVLIERLAWIDGAQEQMRKELSELGESVPVSIRYRGHPELVEVSAWESALRASRSRDMLRGQSHVGPHRDDIVLGLGGHALRDYGSTGQQRCAAIALRLLELETVTLARGVRPALLVDDVFAALDKDRQQRLAARLRTRPGQRIVTVPKIEEIPAQLDLPVWHMNGGSINVGPGLTTPKERPTPLSEALDQWLAKNGLVKRLDQVNAVENWPEAVGPQIAAVTRALSVSADGTLLVRVATHGWATELGLMAPRILTRVNGSRKGRIQQIRWMVGPLDRP